MTLLNRVRTWWYRQLHPGTCRECGIALADDNDTGFCSDEHWTDWHVEHNP